MNPSPQAKIDPKGASDSGPLRLLCATHFFAPSVGGMQVSNTLLVEALDNAGMEVELHVFGQPGEESGSEGVKRYNHPLDPFSLASLRRAATMIVEREREMQPDCVVILDEIIVRSMGLLRHRPRPGSRFVSVNSGSTLTRPNRHFRGRANAWLVRRGYRWLDRLFVATSTATKLPRAEPAVASRIRELGRPVPEWFFTLPPDPGLLVESDQGLPLLFSCARAEPEKGIGLVIEALARLRDARGAELVEFVFAGDGSALSTWRRQAADLGLRHVRFLGAVALDEIRRSFDAAWMAIFVPTGDVETFGRTWVEAFARSLPVISTAVDNLPHLVSDGENGFLVEPDSAEIANVLERALALDGDEYKAMRAAARQSAEPYRQSDLARRLVREIAGLTR